MKWSILQKLYNTTIGSVILVLSLFSTFTLFPIQELYNINLSLIAIGAILLGISFITFKVFIPDEIEDFTIYNYIDRYIRLNKEKYLNLKLEFNILKKYSKEINSLEYIKESHHYDKDYIVNFNLEKIIKLIGEPKVVEFLAKLKYKLSDKSNPVLRWILSFSFLINLGLIYHSSIIRLFTLIKGGI